MFTLNKMRKLLIYVYIYTCMLFWATVHIKLSKISNEHRAKYLC